VHEKLVTSFSFYFCSQEVVISENKYGHIISDDSDGLFFGRIKAWMDVGAMKGLVSNYLRQ
jgi:hypothetical protein